MKSISNIALSVITAFSFTMTSCQKDETDNPAPVNPSELITTVHLILSDSAGSSVIDTVSFIDIDGPGGASPVIDSLIIQSGVTYQLRLLLLDESKNPVLDISEEIAEESDYHLFVFTSAQAQTTTIDTDVNGNPLGLLNLLSAPAAGLGSYRVQLRHFDTPALKTANSQDYETDIEIDFGLRVN
jgi:hypothetical protein